MNAGEPGWILDLSGEAINLAHVRRIRIGHRFQEIKRLDHEPDGAVTFYVEAEMAGASCGDPRPTLAQNIETREAAEHWVASRFWQPVATAQHESAGQITVPPGVVRKIIDARSMAQVDKIDLLGHIRGVTIVAYPDHWRIQDDTEGLTWELRPDA
jgi:hypothetical protein